MGLLGAVLHLMNFVTDCDGTLVHYDTKVDPLEGQGIVTLPKSSSGKIGIVSQKTLELIEEIAKSHTNGNDNESNIVVTCASGMRTATMLQRQPYFPSIKYWITENGGRIFQVKHNNSNDSSSNNNNDNNNDSEGVVEEIQEWKKIAENDHESRIAMSKFINEVNQIEGLMIDKEGYSYMVRIKKNKNYSSSGSASTSSKDAPDLLEHVSSLVPSSLKVTWNLGYLDVCYPHSGKLNAVKWLIKYQQQQSQNNGDSGSSGSSSSGGSSSSNDEGSDDGSEFIYMGDDDNDVEIGRHAQLLLVARPYSKAMNGLIDAYENRPEHYHPHQQDQQEEEQGQKQELKKQSRITQSSRNKDMLPLGLPVSLITASQPGTRGTEELLLQVLNNNKNSGSSSNSNSGKGEIGEL